MDIVKEEFIDRYLMYLRNKCGLREGDFSDAIGVSYREFGLVGWQRHLDSGKILTAKQCVDMEISDWEQNERNY